MTDMDIDMVKFVFDLDINFHGNHYWLVYIT